MPHKFNADRRDKIPKQKRRVTNCAAYDESLRMRGDLTVWISEEARALWAAAPRTTPGGQAVYSDLAIELCLTLGMILKQPLRQTQGLMRSIAGLLGFEIEVPHFTTLSGRGNGLSLSPKALSKSTEPVHLVVDSTGLKVFGEGALSAACCACAYRVINGWSKSIKPSVNGALGASYTLALTLSAARSSAPI
jgi:hypothetical protein